MDDKTGQSNILKVDNAKCFKCNQIFLLECEIKISAQAPKLADDKKSTVFDQSCLNFYKIYYF